MGFWVRAMITGSRTRVPSDWERSSSTTRWPHSMTRAGSAASCAVASVTHGPGSKYGGSSGSAAGTVVPPADSVVVVETVDGGAAVITVSVAGSRSGVVVAGASAAVGSSVVSAAAPPESDPPQAATNRRQAISTRHILVTSLFLPVGTLRDAQDRGSAATGSGSWHREQRPCGFLLSRRKKPRATREMRSSPRS